MWKNFKEKIKCFLFSRCHNKNVPLLWLYLARTFIRLHIKIVAKSEGDCGKLKCRSKIIYMLMIQSFRPLRENLLRSRKWHWMSESWLCQQIFISIWQTRANLFFETTLSSFFDVTMWSFKKCRKFLKPNKTGLRVWKC